MINLSEDVLAAVVAILKSKIPNYEVRAFGSRVSGNPKPYSDLDLALVGKEKMPLQKLMKLKECFEESNIPIRVDLVDWHTISPEFQKVIEQNYEVI